MKFYESLGSHQQRKKKEGFKKPLKTISELAEITELSKMTVANILAKNNGPKPVFYSGGKGNKNSWYEPDCVIEFINEFRNRTHDHCKSCNQDRPLSDFYMKGILTLTPCKECEKKRKREKRMKDGNAK